MFLFYNPDILHKCKLAAYDEKERKRIAARKAKDKDALVPLIPFKSDWFCSTFLVFTELGLPGGKVRCLPIFHLASGSGPLKISSKRSLATTATTADEVRENILQTGGRSARRSIQSSTVAAMKGLNSEIEVESASDAAHRVIIVNFNGLNQWNSKSASLKELFTLVTLMYQGPEAVNAAYQVPISLL